MAISKNEEESVSTISSSFSSASLSSLSLKTSLSSVLQLIFAELHGLHENCSGRRGAPTCTIKSTRLEQESRLLFDLMQEWRCWWLRPTIKPINSSTRNYPASFVSRQHTHHHHHQDITRDNGGDQQQEQQLHCRRHHRKAPSERLNSLTHNLRVVLVIATIFASLPGPVGSSVTEEKNEGLVCMKGVSNSFPGATFPRGDIFLREGDTLEVFCKLNLTAPAAKGYNASNIDFDFHKADIPRDKVRISVVNETTAVVRVDNMTASSPYLECLLRSPDKKNYTHVCQNQIDVGYPPLPVQNFRCIVREWKTLNCTWDLPSNPVPTKYRLTKLWTNMQSLCPNRNATPSSCVWGERTEPHYRPNSDPLVFRLNGTNPLKPSGITWNYKFVLGNILIPEKPKLFVLKKSVVEYTLNWTFTPYEYFKYGLEHELKVCSEFDEECNTSVYQTMPIDGKMTTFYVKTVQLPHAFVKYSFRVRVRSPAANNTEEFWSAPEITHVTTDARAPDHPPETDLGSFESRLTRVDYRDIYIHWKSLPPYMQNGPEFAYEIKVKENNNRTLNKKPDVITDSYAVFQNMSVNNAYYFTIKSKNVLGSSINSSEISVPSTSALPQYPKSVSKVDFTNGSFEISWRRPDRYHGIVSYTVFRCVSRKPRPYPCEGRIEWDRVDAMTIRKFYPLLPQHADRQYQFSVSANMDKLSSGMVWATCLLFHNKVPERLRYVKYEELSEDEILIKWDLECSYQEGDVEGFEITYCQVEKYQDEKCKVDGSSVAVEGANTTKYKLRTLKPYTFYKVYVSILSAAGKSPRSVPVYPKTLEGAPEYPRVSVSQVTNVSATLNIDSPLNPNGVLRRYIIYYQAHWEDHVRELRVTLEASHEIRNFTTKVTLGNLTSNSNYTVYIVGCTTKCSERSDPTFFKTDIGHTDLMSFPQISWSNDQIYLEWDTPSRLGGPIDYFQIRLKRNGEQIPDVEDFQKAEIFEGEKRFYKSLPDITCEPSTNFTVQIRAATRLENGDSLFGGWSPPGNYSCGGTTSWLIWVILVVVTIIGFAVFGFLSHKFYHYFRRMKDGLTIKLPPGLNNELNGFAHKPPPRGRSNENLYGEGTYAYPLKPVQTHTDESKDFLSNSDLNQGEAEESLIEKPFSPSPTNPLLGELDFPRCNDINHMEDDENDIRLTDFGQPREGPTTYKKLGVLTNGSAVPMELIPGPSSRSSPTTVSSQAVEVSTISPTHSVNQSIYYNPNHLPPTPTSLNLRVDSPPTCNGNGINRAVPDVLNSSPASPTSLNSNSSLQGSIEAASPPPTAAPPAPSSSYVKWTTLLPDMKTGDAGNVLDSSNRQSPYCQVGILLDS